MGKRADEDTAPGPERTEDALIDSAEESFLRAAAAVPLIEPPLASDETVGPFRIVGVLGRGGMGIVYRAEDTVLHRTVALKLLPDDLLDDPERRGRFLREARIAAAIVHPAIATVHGVGEDGARVYFAMELVEGESLRAHSERGELPIGEVCRIGASIADALAAAHEKGVVHRDLKPENVMISSRGDVKVLDFGLAKVHPTGEQAASVTPTVTDLRTRGDRLLGTPSYMSPEQAKGREVDTRSDVFALGVVLYELATGKRPFSGASTMEVLIAIDRDRPERPSVIRRDVRGELELLILRCLEKAPERRPSAFEVRDALEAVRTGRRRFHRFVKPVLASLLVAPALLAAALGVRAGMRHETKSASPITLLAATDAVIACPILEAGGVAEPSAWLGAAASDYACRRLTFLLGGRDARTLLPADLLDLPRQPTTDFPEDPYGEANARERTLAAARTRSDLRIGGRIQREGRTFQLNLSLISKETAIAHASARGATVEDAVTAALDELVEKQAVPRAEQLEPELARWLQTPDVDVATYSDELAALQIDRTLCDRLKRAAHVGRALARRHPSVDTMCGVSEPLDPFDPSSLEAAFARAELVKPEQAGAIAVRFREARRGETGSQLLGYLAFGEGAMLFIAGQSEQAAYEATLAGLRHRPRDLGGWVLADILSVHQALPSTSSARPTLRAMRAWVPHSLHVWAPFTGDTSPNAIRFLRRSAELSPRHERIATTLAATLLRADLVEEARALGAEWSDGSDSERTIARFIAAQVHAHEGRFGATLREVEYALAHSKEVVVFQQVSHAGLYVSVALQRSDEYIATWLRVVLSRPDLDQLFLLKGTLTYLCLRAHGAVGKQCDEARARIARTAPFDPQEDQERERALVEASVAIHRGDDRAAARAIRPHLADPMVRWLIPSDVFDRIGELEVAESIDRDLAAQLGPLAGVEVTAVGAARRAFRRGDRSRARELASAVLERWSNADMELPFLAEMREIASASK